MRLTRICFSKTKRNQLIWYNLWKREGIIKEGTAVIPKAIRKQTAIPIVDPLVGTEVKEEWKPPVPDDLEFRQNPKIEEYPNYNKEPAYIFTRNNRLTEGLKQACILTKSQMFEGFPDYIQPLVGNVHIDNEDKLLQRCIMQSQLWDSTYARLPTRVDKEKVGYKFTAEYGIPKPRRIDLFMQGLVNLCQLSSLQYPSVLSDRYIITDAYMSSHYHIYDSLVSFEGYSQYLVLSDKPLKIFGDTEVIEESRNHQLPDMFPISPLISISKRHDYTLQNITGLDREFKYSHSNTIFVQNNNYWSDDQRQATGLMFAFGHALAQAKRLYGDDVTILPQPICIQCVSISETTLNFTFFQLNTLDFTNEDGIKNLVWLDSSNRLFQYKLRQPWKGPEHLATRYHSFNPEGFHKLLAVYLSNTPEAFNDITEDQKAESH